jgi:hypothetical protein
LAPSQLFSGAGGGDLDEMPEQLQNDYPETTTVQRQYNHRLSQVSRTSIADTDSNQYNRGFLGDSFEVGTFHREPDRQLSERSSLETSYDSEDDSDAMSTTIRGSRRFSQQSQGNFVGIGVQHEVDGFDRRFSLHPRDGIPEMAPVQYEGLVGGDDIERAIATFCGILGRCFVAWKEKYTPVSKRETIKIKRAIEFHRVHLLKCVFAEWSTLSWFHSIFVKWGQWAAYRKQKHPGQTRRMQEYQRAYHSNLLSRHWQVWQSKLGGRLREKEALQRARVGIVLQLKQNNKLLLYAKIHHRLKTCRAHFRKWRDFYFGLQALIRAFQLERIGSLVFHSWRLFAQASRQEKIINEMREERKNGNANLVLEYALQPGQNDFLAQII